ncbi:unnamed protein product [Periconia digitata]|uniref:RNA helicase n=1 Tax=Periconia digitata TaxID=1303443 RepID=A0A9W4UBC4_9PLEO|nr:unnamed protein product [Periconia digitata]
MTAPRAPRSPLCLLCSFAATSSRPQNRLAVSLSRTQVAYRNNVTKQKSKAPGKNFRPGHTLHHGYGFRPEAILRAQLYNIRQETREPEFMESLRMTPDTFDAHWKRFETSVKRWMDQGGQEFLGLIKEASGRKTKPLENRLRYWFYALLYGDRFSPAELKIHKEKADLRYPSEWFPVTRRLRRTIHLHVGPTNSGKTYHALKRLEEAKKGIYLGPLRLLAHEIYTRLNSKGIPCVLVTGEETRMPKEKPRMWSCTVEMAPLQSKLDVAVIDEIQMISHKERGWAWTQAFLGLQAAEVHLCGEARTVPIIKELCALTGDDVVVHEYKRLTPLEVAKAPLESFSHLEKGDCVVVFSVLGIHAIRQEIEKKTGRKCAMVYGSLPPETRAQQARLFNDPSNEYDFLVASDAVGMGLNLAIKRIVFESTVKSNGRAMAPLEISDLKQIAGRAGRYKTAFEATTAATVQQPEGVDANDRAEPAPEKTKPQTVGIVTTLEEIDFKFLKANMTKEPEPIQTAGLFPPSMIVERFASYFPPGTPFSYILLRLHEISEVHPRFHLCSLKDALPIADVIHSVKNLSISERYTISAVPANMKDNTEKAFLRSLIQRMAEGETSVSILDIPELPLEALDQPASAARKYLKDLETLHKCLVCYIWLSYRFPSGIGGRKLAEYVKRLTEDAIERVLMEFTYTEKDIALRKKQKKAIMRQFEEKDGGGVFEQEQANVSTSDTVGLPPAVQDVLQDTSSFAEDSPPRDDEGTYPVADLEVLEPEAVGPRAANRH